LVAALRYRVLDFGVIAHLANQKEKNVH
jgi:hypothetical protein